MKTHSLLLVPALAGCGWSGVTTGAWGPESVSGDSPTVVMVAAHTTNLTADQANVLRIHLTATGGGTLHTTFTATTGDPLDDDLDLTNGAEIHWTSGLLYGDCAEADCTDVTSVSLQTDGGDATVAIEAEYTVDGGDAEPVLTVSVYTFVTEDVAP